MEFVKLLIKSRLLRNFSFEEKVELVGEKPTNLRAYYEKILSLDLDVILDRLEEKVKDVS